jgi:hypothetical protein
MAAKIRLAVIQGAQQGKEFIFDQHDTFIFGRMEDCHACLPDDNQVSRHHFLLEANPPDARLRDLGSLNGTYVNGQKYGGREAHETPEQGALRQYPQVDLHSGDEIQVGQTVIRLQVELPPAPLRQPVRCQKCGRDVSREVGPARQGDYVCDTCREQAQSDPLALLAALLAQVRQPSGELNLPDWNIERKLGEGGMGAVYLARHKKDGRRAAVKVMLSRVVVDERARKEFLREVEITRNLKHKNIVEFIDYGSTGSAFYFLMEFCESGSAADLMLRRGGRLSLAEAGPVMLQALEGLAFAHSRDYVHRDLKPHNILLAGPERRWTAKVGDLGLAKNAAKAGLSGMTATGSYGGSFPFMPREQVTNFKYVKPVSDVWSMGATFYFLLTGQFPRDFRRGQDPVEAILHGTIIPLRKRDPKIPPALAEVVNRSLANNPEDRYPNAGEMRKALEKVL